MKDIWALIVLFCNFAEGLKFFQKERFGEKMSPEHTQECFILIYLLVT